jgi:predicted AlkP superfamily pyrophosphatase or phosphodiesterase
VRPITLACIATLALLASTVQAERPQLVVVVSIDQFPYEYLERMQANFAPDGLFRRLLDQGALYTQCHHGHAYTITGPAHSVFLTGTFPMQTGIVENDWFDRVTGKRVYCVSDDNSPMVGGPGNGMSPKNLMVGTLGDVMKLTWPEARVFGVALKDRASILMTGHSANAAYWFHSNSGNWVTSEYYRKDLPQFLRVYNESTAVEAYAGQKWELLLPKEKYVLHYPDDAEFENPNSSLGRAFPHPLPDQPGTLYYDQVTKTPWGNDITLSVAKLLVMDEKLGLGAAPDMLAINLSTNDYIGHAFGPYSLEVQDITYRTDRQLGEFFKFVEQHLRGRPWVLALSSDHGVAPIPEHAKKMGLPAARDPLGDLRAFRDQLEAKLQAEFGKSDKSYVQSFDYGDIYLQRDLPQLQGSNFSSAQKVVRNWLVGHSAIGAAFTRDELLAGNAPGGIALQFQRTFNPERSGDVLFALKPYMISGKTPATHGSPWKYDSHVPLAFVGSMIRPGRFPRTVTPAAMAPTLARLLQIESPPSTSVEPLFEVIAAPGRVIVQDRGVVNAR